VPFAITDDHAELAASVDGLLTRRDALGANRALLESDTEALPDWWADAAGLGWLGLHLPERLGGAGYGVAELAVVVEGCGRHVAPGPLVPTTIVSATLAHAVVGDPDVAEVEDLLRSLADGSRVGGFGSGGDLDVRAGRATGDAGVVLGGGIADLIMIPQGDDLLVFRAGDGVSVEVPRNLDPSRRSARMALSDAPVLRLEGQAPLLRDVARTVLAAEAAGLARRCTEEAARYAKEREQFGRPIGMFQAVKHHTANMIVATEVATAAAWDAARAAESDAEQRAYAAAVAASMAGPAVDLCVNLNTQVHGGIAITWEHDAHLFVRRAAVIQSLLRADEAAADVALLASEKVARTVTVDLPPEAETIRDDVRALVGHLQPLGDEARLAKLIETGYVMPHWPRPFGREAGAVEQLVVEQEFAAAGIKKPSYGITAWVLLTLIQHGTDEQVRRWIAPALRREVIWCQLFSEPAAGSDAAGIRTRATPTTGGWMINGQKVWTTGAHLAGFGLVTVRTDPDAAKHQGITTMVVDMHAPGVTVRPLRQTTGSAGFNEVFFDDVFIPDGDVVGEINAGWTVARATLGNESVSLGGDQESMSITGSMIVEAVEAHPDRVTGGRVRAGRYVALGQTVRNLNLRTAHRAVAGGEPGPEGAVSKLLLSELMHEAASILAAAAGPDIAFLEGDGAIAANLQLIHRALAIAGGTSEIKRSQIAERLLGLPRDPLVT
jgi:hypothetical protein